MKPAELLAMSPMDIQDIDANSLVDICGISPDNTLAGGERLINYLEQIKNPCCFRCGAVRIQIEFNPSAKPLKDKITDYFVGLRNR